jgi:hypothetical protein
MPGSGRVLPRENGAPNGRDRDLGGFSFEDRPMAKRPAPADPLRVCGITVFPQSAVVKCGLGLTHLVMHATCGGEVLVYAHEDREHCRELQGVLNELRGGQVAVGVAVLPAVVVAVDGVRVRAVVPVR